MTVINIVLTVFVIQLILVAALTFGSIAWSLFEETNVGSAISEWIVEKFEKDDKE